ncbi:hypothetical protein CLV86_1981, partial [Lacinutrix venerupis]
MLKNTLKITFILFLLIQSTFSYAQQPNDCVNAVVVCGDSDIVLDVNGAGNNSNEFPTSCSSGENNSLWLEVTVTTSGSLAFTLTPNSTAITEDYDFFIFGPNTTCGNLGPTIRCSTTNPQASGQGNNLTGLSTVETDNFEGPGAAGNSFVSAINATAGDSYFIVIDRPVGNSPFSLQWTGTAQFSDAPTSETDPTGNALDITICNTGNSSAFNLEQNTPLIIGSQTDIDVAYYENESDANIGTNALSSPYPNLNNGQTIYATITNTITNCFTIQEFNLFLEDSPQITSLTSNTSVCSGQDAIFTITGDAGNVVDYNINGGGTVQVTLDAAEQGIVTVAGATADQTITLEAVTNPSTTCTTTLTDTETVTIGANPTITSLTTNTDICSGADAIFTIDATADDVIDYTINGGAIQQVVVDATGQAIV